MANEVIVKQFSEEQAGERVGWVAAMPSEREDVELTHVSVVVSTIGALGAKYGYTDLSEAGGGRGWHADSASGFEDTVSLTAAVYKDGGVVLQGGGYQVLRQSNTHPASQLMSAAAYPGAIPSEDQKLWAQGASNLSEALKTTMQEAGVEMHYPMLYYLLNGYIGHEGLRRFAGEPPIYTPDLYIPDVAMAETTEQQTTQAQAITETLSQASANDHQMRGLLAAEERDTEQKSKLFVKSRRKLQELEEEARKHANTLIVPDFAYLPVGFRPNGRSYPYMGAHPGDNERDFGIELRAIQDGDNRRADHEIEKELKELQHRILWAQHGAAVLRMIGVSERLAGV